MATFVRLDDLIETEIKNDTSLVGSCGRSRVPPALTCRRSGGPERLCAKEDRRPTPRGAEQAPRRRRCGVAVRCRRHPVSARVGKAIRSRQDRYGRGTAFTWHNICDLVLARQEHGLGSDLLAFVSAVDGDDVGTRRASKPCRNDSLMGVVRRGTPMDWLSVMLNLANHGLGIVTEAERCGDLALRSCLACSPNKVSCPCQS